MRRSASAAALCALLILAGATELAFAVDFVVGGKQLTLTRPPNGKGAMSLELRDPSIPVPPIDGADDPSLTGLSVTLFARTSGQRPTFAARAGRDLWKVRSTPAATTFSYSDKTAMPGSADLFKVQLRTGTVLKIRARGPQLTLSQPEGEVAVRVEWGSVRVCAVFDGDAVRQDKVGRFVARNADAPGFTSCDDDILGTVPCEASAACGGTCPGDSVCGGNPQIAGCVCVSPHQPCGGTDPVCNGECPAGQQCGSTTGGLFPECGCLPIGSTPCGGTYPSCGGDCPASTSCMIETFTCCGGFTAEWCACRSEPPPPLCPGGCPEGWTCVPPAPGIDPFCLPPPCSGGSGAPACDGTCSQPGAQCVAAGGLCFCV